MKIKAAYLLRDDRMQITYRDISERAFLERLPGSVKARNKPQYTATPTPYACWLLMKNGYVPDTAVMYLASDWSMGLKGQDFPAEMKTKTDPWSHQNSAYRFAYHKPATGLFLDMGTGKTKITIDLLCNWYHQNVIERPSIIVCPKAVVPHWPEQFETHGGLDVEVIPLNGSSKKNAATVAKHYRPQKQMVFTINYEATWREEIAKELMERKWGAIVCDESHKIKSHNGKGSKFLAKLGQRADKRLALTGTPCPNNPGDVFGQFRFLDAGLLGTSWTRFKGDFAMMHPHIENAVKEWVNQEELQEIVSRISFRVEADDVLDLPDSQNVFVPVILKPKTRKLYEQLKTDLCSIWNSNEITLDNVLVKLLRLQQITAGFCPDDDGNLHDIGTEKNEAIAEWLSDVSPVEPVVLFHTFREERKRLEATCIKQGRRYLEVSGDRHDKETFVSHGKPGDVLSIQIAAGGTGLDGLQHRVRVAGYTTAGVNRGDYDQSLRRILRPGQTRKVRNFHFHARDTVDESIFQSFIKKRSVADYVMEQVARG